MTGAHETLALAGRLHVLLIHLPIGLLVLLVFLELIARLPRFQKANSSAGFILGFAIPAAIASALFGYFLSLGGGYPPELLQLHLWTGIATAATLTLTGIFHFAHRKQAYRGLLAVSFVALIVASHFGGSLTHGSDYLAYFFPGPIRSGLAKITGVGLPKSQPSPTKDPFAQPAFTALIQPILENNCTTCHGEDKSKGGLRLDAFEYLAKGGKSGRVIEPGDAKASELVKRLLLPLEHEDHMPPQGKPQPSPQDIRLIQRWIDSGASPDKRIGELDLHSEKDQVEASQKGNWPASSKDECRACF